MKPLVIYDKTSRKKLAYLQNAYSISYKLETNALWSASFKLPYSDPKNIYCKPFNYVEIWDIDGYGKDKYVGLFRILDSEENSVLNENSYVLEHVFGTLLDSYIIDAVTYGDWHLADAETIAETVEKMLEWQDVREDKRNWILDKCSFNYRSLIEINYQSILDSLYTVTTKLENDNYYWSFNTISYPWKVSLIRVTDDQPVVTDIRYKKNMVGIVRKVDVKDMVNRLYVYGKEKESGRRVNFKDFNNGKEYIDYNQGIAEYGIIVGVIFKEDIKYEPDLLDYAKKVFEKIKYPFITYELDIRTFENAGNLKLGDRVRVIGPGGTIDEYLRVQQIIKDDISKNPNNGKIVLGNGTINIGIIMKGKI